MSGNEEQENIPSEIQGYEDYRKFPVTVKSQDGENTKVYLDLCFVNACYDYGRSLSIGDYDSACALEQAKEFVDKLVRPVGKVKMDAAQYDRDTASRAFGLAFVHLGFVKASEPLTEETIDSVTEHVMRNLEDSGFF